MADYKTIRGTATFEYEEKRSRFIATASFADTEEKALAVLNAVRAANRTARHNVYAYVLQNGRTRYSDDGEPAKTAGTPVLETIGHAGVADVIVVVTRYFGGILLGTGGLVRAYTAAASGALQSAELVSMRLVVDCKVRVSYAQFEQAQRIIAAAETRLDEPIFDAEKPHATPKRMEGWSSRWGIPSDAMLFVGDQGYGDLYAGLRAGARTLRVSPYPADDEGLWDACIRTQEELKELLAAWC